MMRDPITDAAQDPSCLLCLTPDRGGSWWSRLHPPTLRNFAESPETWTVFLQKLSEIALDDCEINLKLVPLQTSSAGVFWGIYFSSNNTQMVINSGTLTDNPLAVILTPSVNEPISIVIKRVGNSVEVLSNEVSKGKRSGNAIDLSTAELGRAISEFNGYLLNASLTNLTTGETVWQAAYSDLYDTSKPWPSDVPRNFTEEPETWYSLQAAWQACDWSHDFSMRGTIQTTNPAAEQAFIYCDVSRSSTPFSVRQSAAGEWYAYCSLGRAAGSTASSFNFKFPDTITGTTEPVRFEFTVIGNTGTLLVEGCDPLTRSIDRLTPSLESVPYSKRGFIMELAFTDLTTGKTVWSYPSEAERVRLITKTNVRTDHGVFEAADDANIAGIATPLDFRGNTKSKTFIVRAFCPAHDPASEKLYIHPFFVQGAFNQGTSFYTFQFSLWEDRRSGKTTQLFPTISIGNDSPGANVTGAEIYLDQWHTYAMVVDYNGGNCYIRAFVDGVLLRERTISGTPVWNTPAATTTQETTVGIRRDPNTSYYAGSMTRISAALIFDRALSAAEIAALTPKQA